MKRYHLLHSVLILALCFATPCHGETSSENAFSPHQGATALVVKTIDGAKQSIHIAAYTFTSEAIADALIRAHQNGVDVEIVLDKSQSKARHTLLTYLLDNNLPTRINRRYAIMHNKFMIVDDKVLELGSFNYTKAAEEKNAENVLVIRRNKKIISSYEKQWEKLWNEAEVAQNEKMTEGK